MDGGRRRAPGLGGRCEQKQGTELPKVGMGERHLVWGNGI